MNGLGMRLDIILHISIDRRMELLGNLKILFIKAQKMMKCNI